MEDLSRPLGAAPGRKLRWAGRLAYVAVALAATFVAYSIGYRQAAPRVDATLSSEAAEPAVEAVAENPSLAVPEPRPPERRVHRGTVRPGDTVSGLLRDLLSPREIHDLAKTAERVFPLTRVAAGQPYRLTTVDGVLESFTYEIDRDEELTILRCEDGAFSCSRVPIEYRVETEVVQGTIRSSLFEAVSQAGEGPELAVGLAEIFAWDIDFLRDIRSGDSFQILVERRFREDAPAGYGRILAAQFVNRGDTFHAVWFQDGERAPGYYDLGGNSLRKAFLKAPLTFTRISSGFTNKRFHPITKTWRAHPAIDYAAPAGTPIKTVGDGVVAERGFTSGNGNYVRIRHNGTYETLYLHMSRFAKGLAKGKRVSQGQVIGYVGSTGLATGPHLCFRMYRNGVPINPMRLKSPSAEPVSTARMAEFEVMAHRLTAQFDPEHLEQASLGSREEMALQ
ncbi:MAG: peptidoglycan DD-metalloendopeptidase family protein [Deferrisomatales bacterium]|nr:peptidoglycan DD-metalloendopeptidase family protein [Deferrisomatales bacterium]